MEQFVEELNRAALKAHKDLFKRAEKKDAFPSGHDASDTGMVKYFCLACLDRLIQAFGQSDPICMAARTAVIMNDPIGAIHYCPICGWKKRVPKTVNPKIKVKEPKTPPVQSAPTFTPPPPAAPKAKKSRSKAPVAKEAHPQHVRGY